MFLPFQCVRKAGQIGIKKAEQGAETVFLAAMRRRRDKEHVPVRGLRELLYQIIALFAASAA